MSIKKLIKMFILGAVVGTFLFLIYGCGTKKVVTNSIVKDNSLISKNDSIRIVERNKKIVDSLRQKITQSNTGDKAFDDAVNKAVSDILSKLNTSKSSGDNSYSLYYDDKLKELIASMNIGATENTKIINNKAIHTKEIIKDTKEIPVRFIPQYVLAASIFGGCCAIALISFLVYRIYRIFTPKVPKLS